MQVLQVLFAVFLILFLGVVGHDLYLTYADQDFSKPMMLSELGYLWSRYGAQSYQMTKDSMDSVTWVETITPILQQKSVIVTGIPAAVLGALMLTVKLFGKISVPRGGAKKGFEYKRK